MATILDPMIPDSGQKRGALLGLASAIDAEASSAGRVVLVSTDGETRTFEIQFAPLGEKAYDFPTFR